MKEALVEPPEKILQALSLISGEQLEARIDGLAEISASKENKSVTRLALSVEDMAARQTLKQWMQEAGMNVEEHPLGLIGIYEGLQPELAAVGFGSHFDSVPGGGRYDGTVGVIGAIATVAAFNEAGAKFPRALKVFAFTGEESSRFSTGLFGSRGMFLGLSEADLEMKRPEDVSLGKALKDLGFDPEQLKNPSVNPQDLADFLELHVEQGPRLEQAGIDIAAVEAIAAPDRRIIEIGKAIESKTSLSSFNNGLKITIEGKTGHSGSTAMGKMFRADGLQPGADLLMVLPAAFRQKFENKKVGIFIKDLKIEGEFLNKIPGKVSLEVVFSGDDEEGIKEAKQFIQDYLKKLNKFYGQESMEQFDQNPISYEAILPAEILRKETNLFSPEQILPHYKTSGRIIKAVESICGRHSGQNIVGTIGIFHLKDNGIIELRLDLRGLEGKVRDEVAGELETKFQGISQKEKVDVVMGDPLTGSGRPTVMDKGIVEEIRQAAECLGLKSETVFSLAGHDAQNIARAGIPCAMIFVPSRNGGVSHCPDEYSTPKDLENGTKVLAVAIYELANSITKDKDKL